MGKRGHGFKLITLLYKIRQPGFSLTPLLLVVAFYTGLIQLPSPCSGKNISGKKARETGNRATRAFCEPLASLHKRHHAKWLSKKGEGRVWVILLRVQFLPSCLDFLFRVS